MNEDARPVRCDAEMGTTYGARLPCVRGANHDGVLHWYRGFVGGPGTGEELHYGTVSWAATENLDIAKTEGLPKTSRDISLADLSGAEVRPHVTIACDESGSEGENLMAAKHRVFTHASHNLSSDECAALMEELRRRWPSQAPEYKAKQLLGRSEAIRWLLTESILLHRAKVALIDKEYMVVSKVIDLLIEEKANAEGVDLYEGGRARQWAFALMHSGERAYGREAYLDLLRHFNSLARSKQRGGVKTSVQEFFAIVDSLRYRCRLKTMDGMMHQIWETRPFADAFEDSLEDDTMPTMEPLFPALFISAGVWFERFGLPVAMVHDNHSELTAARIETVKIGMLVQHPQLRKHVKPVKLTGIYLADSKTDARVQVADLLAGVARMISSKALESGSHSEAANLRPYTALWSLWCDQPSWDLLHGDHLDEIWN